MHYVAHIANGLPRPRERGKISPWRSTILRQFSVCSHDRVRRPRTVSTSRKFVIGRLGSAFGLKGCGPSKRLEGFVLLRQRPKPCVVPPIASLVLQHSQQLTHTQLLAHKELPLYHFTSFDPSSFPLSNQLSASNLPHLAFSSNETNPEYTSKRLI